MKVIDQRFDGKVAVVTGGASGIGEAVVRRLAAEGARVVAGDINEDRLKTLADLGDSVVTQHANVTSEDDLAAMVALAVERFGALDLAFNVAGAGGGAMIADLTEEAWDFTVDLCLKAVVFGMKHQIGQMLKQGTGGAIVNVASLNSKVPMYFASPYCAAKAGAAMVSQVAALEYGEQGIRVNAISPGLTDTPLTAPMQATPGVREAYLERIPLKRVGTPDDMASAALYLASDDASYISGVNLVVDGAWEQTGYPDLRPFRSGMMAARQPSAG